MERSGGQVFSANPERKTVCPRNRKQNHARAVFEKGRKLFQRGSDAGLIDKFRTPEQLMQDGQFLNDYVLSSDVVKSKVIEQYLRSLKEGLPPKTLADDGLACVSPTRKPKTVEEAGIMFLKNNE